MGISRRARWLSSAGLALRFGLVATAVPVRCARAMRCVPKRRGPVIAIVVALLLLASPSLVVASASGRADAGRASSSRGVVVEHPYEIQPNGELLAIGGMSQQDWDNYYTNLNRLQAGGPLLEQEKAAINNVKVAGQKRAELLKSLKAGARSLAGGIAQAGAFALIGWVLDQWGLGSGIEGQIAEIRTQLNQIQNTLNQIQTATAELRKQFEIKDFEQQAREAGDIIAPVDSAFKDLNYVAHLSKDDPTKKSFTEATLRKIDKLIVDHAQGRLANRTRDLIAAAYKVELAHHRFWTLLTSLKVREVVEYYQDAEARLLTLRVDYMHAHPETYPGEYIEGQSSDVEGTLQKQDSELKALPGGGCDRRHPHGQGVVLGRATV